MKNPNNPDEFPGQIRKAFVGTEPTKAPRKTGVDGPGNGKPVTTPKPPVPHG